MVKALHAADIEVILDVVYNHTAEGDERGPVYSFKGIDNSTYYLMSGNPGKPYTDFSGTGNTLRCSKPAVRRMIVDSARYWFEEMHVDGFRFDLASVLARNDDGSLNWEDPIDLRPAWTPWTSASSRSPGTPRGRTSSDARSPPRVVSSGTAASGTTCAASCAATPAWCRPSCSDSTAATIYSRTTECTRFIRTRASTTSPATTGSPCTTSCPYDRKHNQANGHDNTRRPGRELQLELRLGGGRGGPGERVGAAEATGEELLLLDAAGERNADVPRG